MGEKKILYFQTRFSQLSLALRIINACNIEIIANAGEYVRQFDAIEEEIRVIFLSPVCVVCMVYFSWAEKFRMLYVLRRHIISFKTHYIPLTMRQPFYFIISMCFVFYFSIFTHTLTRPSITPMRYTV